MNKLSLAKKITKSLFIGNFWQILNRFTWSLPQTLVGNIISHSLNLFDYVNCATFYKGAIVLDTNIKGGAFAVGNQIIGPKKFKPQWQDHLFVHEFGHYLQSQRTGLFYLLIVGLPSITEFFIYNGKHHDTRWYEAQASKLGANYFYNKQTVEGVENKMAFSFDMKSFCHKGIKSAYINTRNGGYNLMGFSTKTVFHWSDIPINLFYNLGFGLLGFWNSKTD